MAIDRVIRDEFVDRVIREEEEDRRKKEKKLCSARAIPPLSLDRFGLEVQEILLGAPPPLKPPSISV